MAAGKKVKVIKGKRKYHTPFGFRITKGIISAEDTMSVVDVARILSEHQIGAVVVKAGGTDRLAGIISERDITYKVVAQKKPYGKTRAGDIMTKDVVTVNLDEGLKAIHEQMKCIPFRHLPVRKGDNVVGMVSNRDLMYLRRLRSIHYA